MDFIEGLPSSNGRIAILVVVAHLSKCAHFVVVKHPIIASQLTNIFFENVGKLYGIPSSIVSDRDKLFAGEFWHELYRLQGSKFLAVRRTTHNWMDNRRELTNVLRRTLGASIVSSPLNGRDG